LSPFITLVVNIGIDRSDLVIISLYCIMFLMLKLVDQIW